MRAWYIRAWVLTMLAVAIAILSGCTQYVTVPVEDKEPCIFSKNASTDVMVLLRDSVPEDVLAGCSEIIIMDFPDGIELTRPIVSG